MASEWPGLPVLSGWGLSCSPAEPDRVSGTRLPSKTFVELSYGPSLWSLKAALLDLCISYRRYNVCGWGSLWGVSSGLYIQSLSESAFTVIVTSGIAHLPILSRTRAQPSVVLFFSSSSPFCNFLSSGFSPNIIFLSARSVRRNAGPLHLFLIPSFCVLGNATRLVSLVSRSCGGWAFVTGMFLWSLYAWGAWCGIKLHRGKTFRGGTDGRQGSG